MKKNFGARLNMFLELIAHRVVTVWVENIPSELKFFS